MARPFSIDLRERVVDAVVRGGMSCRQAAARFGASVGTAGDVNGDGYSDLIVGAYLFDNGETDEGKVFLYRGSASGLGGSPAWSAESNQANAQFGASAATAGDVNGDGYADVIIGAFGFTNGETAEGRQSRALAHRDLLRIEALRVA